MRSSFSPEVNRTVNRQKLIRMSVDRQSSGGRFRWEFSFLFFLILMYPFASGEKDKIKDYLENPWRKNLIPKIIAVDH